MAPILQYLRTPSVISVCVIVFILLTITDYADSRPSWTTPDNYFIKKFGTLSQCDQDIDLMELCQRCAKATKSNLAYPMCCTNSENATPWCKEFIFFGIHD